MSEVIRVTDGKQWAYVPATPEEQSRLSRFASAGMAEVTAGTVYLKSDGGPMYWDALNRAKEIEHDNLRTVLQAVGSDSLNLTPDEMLVFGKKDDGEYNEFADISLVKKDSVDLGLRVAARPIQDNEIVMTLWPKSGALVPAKASTSGRRVWLELAEPQDEGERCFILDEKCSSLLTVSLESKGGNRLLVLNPLAIDSWLCASGSKAVMGMSDRFRFEPRQGEFVIIDGKTGKKFMGRFFFANGDQESLRLEEVRIQRLLHSKGLGAILPTYELRKVMGDN